MVVVRPTVRPLSYSELLESSSQSTLDREREFEEERDESEYSSGREASSNLLLGIMSCEVNWIEHHSPGLAQRVSRG